MTASQEVKYAVAERFRSIQGEGCWAGTPMAFVRFTGCSVGKGVCHACDTQFEKPYDWLGGGFFSAEALLSWAFPFEHLCLTGGEPLDRNLSRLFELAATATATPKLRLHLETSGTVPIPEYVRGSAWVCVSPKPGFLEEAVVLADEVKVIVPGLGDRPGWPGIEDALRWAETGKPIFLQPRNGRIQIDEGNLAICQELVRQHPQLRLSVQMHKVLRVR